MKLHTTILWFRGADLRLTDNPALDAAMAPGGPVVPAYIHDPEAAGPWGPGTNAREWLARSLGSLDADLRTAGSKLVLRRGAAEEELAGLAQQVGASRIVFARRWEPWARAQEARVSAACQDGIEAVSVSANLLSEPGTILTGKGTPYRVFTPFFSRWRDESVAAEDGSKTPKLLATPSRWPDSQPADIVLTGSVDPGPRSAGVLEHWAPGEKGALDRLVSFTEEALASYRTGRDRPDLLGTSQLSPHIAHGEVSVARVALAVRVAAADLDLEDEADSFIRQLAWREFAAHVLAAEPDLPQSPVRRAFERFPWSEDDTSLEAWQRGATGFPLVDAGMRQLLESGWMHNRVRMVVASFLAKDLLIPWQQGQRWFWDRLVDADLASNAFGWQWVAGCGHDAAPYFRIFNPLSQERRFDPDGDYVRRWAPRSPGLTPIIDHGEARTRALAAYDSIASG